MDERVVKQHVAERRDRRHQQAVAARHFFDMRHDIRQPAGKAKRNGKLAERLLKVAHFLHRKAVKPLTAHKRVARHHGGRADPVALNRTQHLVGAVAHAVENDRLTAVFERLPNIVFLLQK